MGKLLRFLVILNDPDAVARGVVIGQTVQHRRDVKAAKARRRAKQREVRRDTRGRFSGSGRR